MLKGDTFHIYIEGLIIRGNSFHIYEWGAGTAILNVDPYICKGVGTVILKGDPFNMYVLGEGWCLGQQPSKDTHLIFMWGVGTAILKGDLFDIYEGG